MKRFAGVFRKLGNAIGHGRYKPLRRWLRLLSDSPLFDASWYLQSYPDVRDSGVDPARHYLESGWKEGRDPGPDFSTSSYLKANADVAALGINPLLHFIEFGQAEGRGMPSQASPPRSSLDPEKFGPAATCVRFADVAQTPVAWRRAAQITRGSGTLSAGEETLAIASELVTGDQFEQALALLGWLSGQREEAPSRHLAAAGECPPICDIWHAGRGILRSRWDAGPTFPLAVRAVQHVGPDPVLIGEGLISSSAEVFDARLLNLYFPLLLLFCGTDGTLRGLRLVHFPSLCRGGVHYPEQLAAMHTGQPPSADVITVDAELGALLCRMRLPSATPLVNELTVDISGAGGTHKLFQPDFQRWLADVMQVRVRAAPGIREGTAASFLEMAIQVAPGMERNQGAAELRLAHNMVPAIGALVSAASGVENTIGSMAVSDEDDSQPALLVRVPAGMPADGLTVRPASFPTLHPTELDHWRRQEPPSEMLLALKATGQQSPSEAELLFPSGVVGETSSAEPAITWLIAAGRDSDRLRWTLESLSLQSGSHQLLLVGRPSREVIDFALQSMKGAARVAKSISAASSAIETELVGQIGCGIILHDRQTIAILSKALLQSRADIVSAPILNTGARGKNWVLHAEANQASAALRCLPGSLVPMAEVPGEFWVARRDQLANISNGIAGRHMLCTHVSVSRLAAAEDGRVPFQPAADPALPVISFETLVG